MISVITPAYNAESHLQRAIGSLRAQTRTDWEGFIIDDGSTDNTARIARHFAQTDGRITCLSTGHRAGAARARNFAIRRARGRYIAFLDADDEWAPNKLERQISFMSETGAALSYTGFWRNRRDRMHRVHVPANVTRSQLLRGNVIGCLTAIYDRDQLGTCEVPVTRMRHDFLLWAEILSRIDMAHGLDEPLATYHPHAASLSANRWRSLGATWGAYHQHLGFAASRAAWLMGNHLLRRVIRG